MEIEPRPQSRLPQGGGNLFQEIKQVSMEAEVRGINLIRLSIGQPHGPALESARRAASEAVLSGEESMHEYQDNGSPGIPDFARRFVEAHQDLALARKGIDFLPIPGIKPMLGLIPLACGATEGSLTIVTTTKPGYPTPRDWARNYLHQNVVEVPLNPENEFRFSVDDIPSETSLIMMNYPHNPSGQIATKEWLEQLCEFAEKSDIRLFNDAAYIALSHAPDSTALAEVAVGYPNLSWAEAYSASKLIGNGTGWRVGAMVGSSDFIGNIKTIKGNTDSGFAAPMAAGALYSLENDKEGIARTREVYGSRLLALKGILRRNGMRLAVEPRAGFFSLWETPRRAFGKPVESAQQFNFAMIEKTGIVGVHFEQYIRYAVTSDIDKYASKINDAFKKAHVSYD